jgi:hypothetical protein
MTVFLYSFARSFTSFRMTAGEKSWRFSGKIPSLRTFYYHVMCGQKNRKKTSAVAVARKMLSIMRAMRQLGFIPINE